MRHVVRLLALAALLGVVGATGSACVIGLFTGTGTWCGFPLEWPLGAVVAIPVAVVVGLPVDWLFRRLHLRRWWQFLLIGLLSAIPVWYVLADPFASVRWLQSGGFDSLNYLGTGAVAGLAYWWLRVHRAARSNGVSGRP
jgi:hypothetical protein